METTKSPYIEVKEKVQPTDLSVQVYLCTQLQLQVGKRFVVAVISATESFGSERWVCDVFEINNGKFDTSKPLWRFMDQQYGDSQTMAELVYLRMIQRLHRNQLVEVIMTEQGLQCNDGQMM